VERLGIVEWMEDTVSVTNGTMACSGSDYGITGVGIELSGGSIGLTDGAGCRMFVDCHGKNGR